MTQLIDLSIADRRSFAEGASFGDTGPFERLGGRATFAVDPAAPAQASVTDIQLAPVDEDGFVRFSCDVCVLKPVDSTRGNGRLLCEWPNRGNKRALQSFNDAPASNDPLTMDDAGNGFLFRRGYSVLWAAWQGDLWPGDGRMLIDVPVASDGGAPVTGAVRVQYIAGRDGIKTFPLSGHISSRSYPTISRDTSQARLTRQTYPGCDRELIPAADWSFAREEKGDGLDAQGGETALVPSETYIHMPGGFQRGWIYELVYTARDPLILGLGFVAVRELVSYLKHGKEDRAGKPNPFPGGIDKAYAWGRSQSGRGIRDFVYLGFNADSAGRRVFEGVMPHAAGAGRLWLNHRFANGSATAGQQYEDHYNLADRFPFSYARTVDHLTGRGDAILKRPATDPLVIHTQSATEYWQRRGSLVHTDTRGNDLPQPENVRLYHWASSQHVSDPQAKRPVRGCCQNPENVVVTSMLSRPLLDALDRWGTDGTPPPDSRVPSRGAGTLVTYEEWRARFPAVPGLALPRGANGLPLLDFGPHERDGLVTKEPPEIVDAEGYPVFVPAVDADGNEADGVRAPMVAAPMGSYTGWNLRARGFGTGAMFEFSGSYIPFPGTPEERRATGDPRLSVLERYGDAGAYARAIKAAARALVSEGLLLEEDVDRAVKAARNWGRPRHEPGLAD